MTSCSTNSSSSLAYSFSMINLVQLMPQWSWEKFDQVIAKAGTSSVELIPSMVLGFNWDQQLDAVNGPTRLALEQLQSRCSVGTIQSLTYGLDINLADDLSTHPGLLRRLQGLIKLGRATECHVFILGSPGQKKHVYPEVSKEEHKQRFVDTCHYIASILEPKFVLSLEHNTLSQGAEFCNTLADICEVVTTLRAQGVANVGLNLDTKCLIHEMGEDIQIEDVLADQSLRSIVTSIQVSLDFLTREVPHRHVDQRTLKAFARESGVPISIEEFGLMDHQVTPFVEAWNLQ
jgi:hypothetical protein